ncbi:MAG: FAD-linked oxidase C-terminal domain-containing protein [Thermoanaerobaculia bacterium]
MTRRDLSPGEVRALAEIVGDRHLLAGADDLAPYAKDWTRDLVALPAAVARPRTTQEVSRLLAFCNAWSIPVTPQGGRTGLSGGALAIYGGLGLSLDRMTSILEIDADNFVAVAEAGVVTQTLQEAVEEKGLYYPPDPASRGSCTIGGNVAENAGGPHAAKYGVTGRWILGLTAVFADGTIADTGGKTRKDVAGYDLTALLVGSEGTLAVVTKAWLRLIAKPAVWATVLAPFASLEAAAAAVFEIHRRGLVPSACEVVDRPAVEVSSKKKGVAVPFPEAEARLLLDFDGPTGEEVEREVTAAGEVLLECGALDVALAADEPRRRELWDVRRGIAEAIHELGVSYELDLAVPRSQLVPLVDGVRRLAGAAGLRAFAYGHAADGNLHVRLLREGPAAPGPDAFESAADAIYREAVRLGGTITGEHGVGFTLRDRLPMRRPPAFVAAMRAVKAALDPNGILNPGKVIPAAG